jgi:UDP-2,3-diacylglucosamine pyrophosphatase LpxH
MTNVRTVTIVSDLHLGGDPGFRMMTEPDRLAAFIEDITARDPATDEQELVINGDFVDFLSETHGTNDAGEPQWEPFIADPGRARECFRKIAAGMDAPVFDALAALLERGHRLTVLPGNHDVELCLPAVRQALLERLRVRAGHDLDFRHDGEGYVIGNALVEHGNRYDESNFIDHERLHNLRVKQSLRQDQPASLPFAPPLGSFFVARAMNTIKKKHAFVDLLKPEGPALVALLLAIDPELRDAIAVMVKLAREHKSRHSEATDAWSKKTVFRGSRSSRSVDGDLAEVLGEALGDDLLEDLSDAVVRAAQSPPRMRGGSQRGGVSETWELLGEGGWEVIRLIGGGRRHKQVKRLELLRRAVRKLGASPAFTRDTDEPDSPYLAAARELAWSEEHPDGFRFVIFGHTHHAKDIALDDHGTRYLNSGTWANLMSFPAPLFDPTTDEQRATDVLRGFLDDLEQGQLVPHVRFEPTYVRLWLAADGNVQEAKVETFRAGPPSRPASP